MIHRSLLLLATLLLSASASAQEPAGEDQRLFAMLSALEPQRPGVVDAYVVVVAFDSDPVFNREAREAGKVLARRFDAAGRTIVLARDEGAATGLVPGSPQSLSRSVARAAELMDRNEDVLILYTTSHGRPGEGLIYRDADRGEEGALTPSGLAGGLRTLGIANRLLILQACYAGQFVPALRSPSTIIVTAAAADRSSFGCEPGNDWTYFGDALINHAFRQPLPLDVQLRRALALIAAAEQRDELEPSNPQVSIGSASGRWLAALDAREPKTATAPVGRSVLRARN